ncbi:DUF2894 domain-containing protein [Pseudidiomarina gelatinasegens]|uniref:DUF2894 domain-containing protein n=1 Tax=Pseudidiomarina gelatinasegens TaxID=2487740 RepID=UPI003A97612D
MSNEGLADLRARLARLEADGASRFDPVRYRFVETLVRRLEDNDGEASQTACLRTGKYLAELHQRLTAARQQAQAVLARSHQDDRSQHSAVLQHLFDLGDFQGVIRASRRGLRGQPSPLAGLREALREARPVREVRAGPPDLESILNQPSRTATRDLPDDARPRPELRALAAMRAAQARQQVAHRIAGAIANTPADAGPLNGHRLVTRAIQGLQQLSPEYLHWFVGYTDTLLWLETEGKRAGK